jgi:hypothetical protein
LFALLLPFQLVAQKPLRHYDFISRKQTGLYVGEFSISPKGNMLLATFNDLDKKAVYELVNISNGKMLSTGPLPSIPFTIAWSDDEKMVAIGYRKTSPVCYDVYAGMKKIFSTQAQGEPVFSGNDQLLNTNFSPELFVFADETIYRYNGKGNLLDSIKTYEYSSYERAWFDRLHNRFVLVWDGIEKLAGFSMKDKKLQPIGGTLSDTYASNVAADKDGSKFYFYDDNDLYVHDAGDGKRITNYHFNKIATACFTPDSKNILVVDNQQISLLNLQGKLVKTVRRPAYYSCIGYGTYGKELIAANPDGFDVFACQDYFFTKEEPVVIKPPVVTNPVKPTPAIIETKPVVKEKPWSLPYTIREFITPFDKDSFYLYTADRSLRYFIRYEKTPSGGLWPSSFGYSQFFGFSKDAKYQLVNLYVLDMTDSTARMGTYQKSGLIEKPMMFGGPVFLGKISSSPSGNLSWPMKIYEEEFTLSAKLIDNMYKGKKAKCLVVTRNDPKNGVNETYYYQQGVGLIKIESNGKVGFER